MQRRTVLLVRSDECGWTDLRFLMEKLPCALLLGEATSSGEAIHMAESHRPDVIIAALRLDGLPTLPLLAELRNQVAPRSKFAVVAADFTPGELLQLADVGTSACLLWNGLSVQALEHCLAAIISGEIVVASQVVADTFMADLRSKLEPGTPPVRLTERERVVLCRLADGLSQKEVAQAVGISQRSVERTVGTVKVKLGTPTQFSLAVKAAQLRLH